MTGAAGEFAIATFASTHAVLKAEQLLQGAGLSGIRLVPVPSQLSSDCGVSVRFPAVDAGKALEALFQLQEDLEGVFVQRGKAWERFTPE